MFSLVLFEKVAPWHPQRAANKIRKSKKKNCKKVSDYIARVPLDLIKCKKGKNGNFFRFLPLDENKNEKRIWKKCAKRASRHIDVILVPYSCNLEDLFVWMCVVEWESKRDLETPQIFFLLLFFSQFDVKESQLLNLYIICTRGLLLQLKDSFLETRRSQFYTFRY